MLDRVQMKTAQFSNNTKDSDWVNLALRRMTTRLCALFKVHSGEGARKVMLIWTERSKMLRYGDCVFRPDCDRVIR